MDDSVLDVDIDDPRYAVLSMVTQPGDYMFPSKIEITAPETVLGNGIPLMEICQVKLISVGKNLRCIQKDLFTDDSKLKVENIQR
jgi:hypothetical protein